MESVVPVELVVPEEPEELVESVVPVELVVLVPKVEPEVSVELDSQVQLVGIIILKTVLQIFLLKILTEMVE